MYYYAHSGSDGKPGDWHRLGAQLRDTGERAERFLQASGHGPLARTAGLLHDLGKYSADFQQRLFGDPKSVNHSTAGALVAVQRYGDMLGKMLAFCIAGHHAGLANGVHGERTRALGERLAEAGDWATGSTASGRRRASCHAAPGNLVAKATRGAPGEAQRGAFAGNADAAAASSSTAEPP